MEFMRVPDPRVPATVPPSGPARPDFELRVARALSLLSAANLRLSVFVVRVHGGDGPALCERLRTALGRSHEVAGVDDDTVGVLYYGPRPFGPGSDRQVEAELHVRLSEVLGSLARDAVSLQALHVSCAHVVDVADLIRTLRNAPVLPLSLAPSDGQHAARPIAA